MNKTKQFWTLLKFQATTNPFILGMVFPLGIPFILMGTYQSSFDSFLETPNLLFIGIIGLWALAPEMMQPWGTTTAWNYSGTEFLLTRAIDRPLLYRARAAFLYIFVLLIPFTSFLYSWKKTDLTVNEDSKLAQQECLSHVPGSQLKSLSNGNRSTLIFIPRGNILIQEWHFWIFAISILAVQVLLLLIHSLKHRLFIFYAVIVTSIFSPFLIDLQALRDQMPSHMERLFFSFAAHKTEFLLLTVLAVILGQLWCERRFARLEQ